MKTHFEYETHLKSQRLAGLKTKTEELERQLSVAHASLERELAQFARRPAAPDDQIEAPPEYDPADADREAAGDSPGQTRSPDGRTEVLVNHGRRSSYRPGFSRRSKITIGVAFLAMFVAILVTTLSRGGVSWPSSVTTVQSEAVRSCRNPDVKSEPGQVNFACAKTTRQILWVFALMTSAANPNFADTKTGRLGLEPITPAQGGEVAWSLNLHHPYDPSNPIDSLQVAARAINNIIGGATLVGADGNSVVQSGLESKPANCLRYTGSAAVTSRRGFPKLCARPVTSPSGQAALAADVYKKWVVGASPQVTRDVAVLFQNAANPGDPRVQAILKNLPHSKLPA